MLVGGGLPTDPKVRLEDVADVEAFALWIADRHFSKNGNLTPMQRDEAQHQATFLIFELHKRWDPARCAKFSAYLLTYLPKALTSWWRKELRQSGRGSWSGSAGEYTYFGTLSLDAQTEAEHEIGAGHDAAGHTLVDRSLTVAGPGE